MSGFTWLDFLAACVTAAAGWLHAHKSRHPLIGQTMWGGNPVTAKFSVVDDTVHWIAKGLGVGALAHTIARVAGWSPLPVVPYSPTLLFGALACAAVTVPGLTESLRAIGVHWARRRWWPAACAAVRPRVDRYEDLIALGGVWRERAGEMATWPPEELARVRAMDTAQAEEGLRTYETLLELDHRGSLADRVARLRALVGASRGEPDNE